MEILRLVPWQVWVLISGLLTGIGQMVGKRQVHHITSLQAGVIKDFSMVPFVLILWYVSGHEWFGWMSIVAMINGALVAMSIAYFYIAMRENVSGTTLFAYLMSQVLIVISAASLFSEWVYFDPSTIKGIGNLVVLVLTIAAMAMYTRNLKMSKKWLKVLLISVCLNVIGSLTAKWLLNAGMSSVGYQFSELSGLALGGLFVLLYRGQSLRVGWKSLGIGMVQGLITMISIYIYLSVLKLYPISIASLVRRLAVLGVTITTGLFYYHERKGMGRKAWISLGMAILAFVVVMLVNTPSP